MRVTDNIPSTRHAVAQARAANRTIGFVPTMGFLHAGHLDLINAAIREHNFTVVSIFVNPTQFAPHEDFNQYPRDLQTDLHLCQNAGVDLVFTPSTADMYAPDATTSVHVSQLTDTLCGASRPGHFVGVATVVAKLFNIVQPDRAYFGQKDAQQLAVIRRLVRDLNFPIDIVGCPTVREPDGLALSSRNTNLSTAERPRARCLYHALCNARDAIAAGQRDASTIINNMRSIVEAADPRHIDYISIVNPDTLQPVNTIDHPVLIALAVRFSRTRLIDNLTIDPANPAHSP